MAAKIILSFLLLGPGVMVATPFDTARVETLTGLKGIWNAAEGVFKVTQPRSDLPIKVDGWAMPPFMGLTTWASFMVGGKADMMVMGDLVLLEDEVNPVMSAALDAGLEVTALHNHFFYAEPAVFFMHIGGEGTLEQLAGGVKAVLAREKEIRAAHPSPARAFGPAPSPAANAITGAVIEGLLGTKGQAKDGMFKVVIGRTAKMACGCEVGKEMGVNTWAAFAGTDADAVMDGDFAVHEDELQPVLKSLRAAGVNIVAIHHHMTHEQPRYIFLHFWARGPLAALAGGLQQTLAVQAAVR